MNLTGIRGAGKSVCSSAAVLCAALCLTWSCPSGRVVFAEEVDAVVDDPLGAENTVTEDAAPEGVAALGESAPPGTDPAQIEGLFEVSDEQAGYSGDAIEVSDGKKKDKKKDEKKLIVGYRQVGAQASIHFEMGEKPSLSRILQQAPSSLDVYFLGEKKPQNLSCTWESYGDDYSSTNLNYYFFVPKFDSDKYEVKGLNLQSESPYVEVIQDAFTFDMIESAPPKENEAAVFKYCTDVLHLNTAAACGILANIYCESGFRTNAIGDGGTSVGLCQWHNARWTNLRNYAPDDWQTLEGQLRFMRRELLRGYSPTLKYLRSVSDDEQGAYDAAYYWCMHYEMPDRILSRSTTRGYLAKNVYWKRYGLGEDTETEAETEAGEETEAETEAVQAQEEKEPTETEAGALPAETETETLPEETETFETESEKAEGKMDVSYAGTYRCISDDGLNIRVERSTEVDVAGFIPFNGIVTVHRADGEWALVTYGREKGYSKLEYLERIADETETETEK